MNQFVCPVCSGWWTTPADHRCGESMGFVVGTGGQHNGHRLALFDTEQMDKVIDKLLIWLKAGLVFLVAGLVSLAPPGLVPFWCCWGVVSKSNGMAVVSFYCYIYNDIHHQDQYILALLLLGIVFNYVYG